MTYLLDTHYILWVLFDPLKITKQVRNILLDHNHEKLVSGISLWEISLKYSLGKLDLEDTDPEEIHSKLIESGCEIFSVENELFSSYHNLPQAADHKDPFDRLLIWQAIRNSWILISQDEKIVQYQAFGLKVVVG
jgi:PIN domain nuclease of toxin-antitoxin system